MNFGSTGGALGGSDPMMNRTLSGYFAIAIELFSMISYMIKGLFGVK